MWFNGDMVFNWVKENSSRVVCNRAVLFCKILIDGRGGGVGNDFNGALLL